MSSIYTKFLKCNCYILEAETDHAGFFNELQARNPILAPQISRHFCTLTIISRTHRQTSSLSSPCLAVSSIAALSRPGSALAHAHVNCREAHISPCSSHSPGLISSRTGSPPPQLNVIPLQTQSFLCPEIFIYFAQLLFADSLLVASTLRSSPRLKLDQMGAWTKHK